MAIIPLKNTVTITPSLGTDEWDRPIPGAPYTLRCRIQEGTKLVRSSTAGSGVHGVASQEVVSVAQIYFDKVPPIGMSDTITYTDENGNVRTYMPISIEIKRGPSGKALLTVVNV